jgi:AcrR family transcriptional regulator
MPTAANIKRTAAKTPIRPGTRTRKSAEERRDEIVTVALEHFALAGYNGASTEAIARDAGISQPYLFRLFGTKRDLFLACYDRAHERITSTFEDAARGQPRDGRLEAMGKAYVGLLADQNALRFQMQAYAACADSAIRAHVRECYGESVRLVERLSGAPPHEVWQFFSHGMLLNVIASLDLETIAGDQDWAARWCAPSELIRRARAQQAEPTRSRKDRS